MSGPRNKLSAREGLGLPSGKVMKVVNRKVQPTEREQRLIEDAWLGIDVPEDLLYNPLDVIPRSFDDDPHIFLLWILSRPEYLYIFCKHVLNVSLWPTQAMVICELWSHKFPMLIGSRGFSKTFSLAIYGLIRALFMQGRKIICTGASFRQSKILFEYCENVYKNAPLLRDIVANGKRDDQVIVHDSSLYRMRIGDSNIMCIPMGSGDTIRGLRANDIFADEMSSINKQIFENVVAGFGVVSSSPLENIKRSASKRKMKELGIEEEENKLDFVAPNQIVLSGTCSYRFNHFFDYFSKYKDIITSCGDRDKLRKIVGDEIDNPAFDWRDYSIVRIPYNLLPDGYLDSSQISRSKVTVTASNFLCEYGACFAADSDGFFRRTLIESCVPSSQNRLTINEQLVDFIPMLNGNPHCRYVYAIDPASETDNFALVIIELRETHRRIVYCWTTNKKLHRKNLTDKKTSEDNYWAFCVRKVRNLMKRFPCTAIAIDSQGGGNAVREAFSDKDKLEPKEQQIWPVYQSNGSEYSDRQEGLHIIHMAQFANNEWLSNAYFNTKKDFEEKLLLFPSFDGATICLTECNDDLMDGGLDDNMELIVEEIEELKNELTCIMHQKTPTGKDQFLVPDVKNAEGKKVRMKKDRASALIMCNSLGRSIMRDFVDFSYESNGGFATPQKDTKGALYSNPWYSQGVSDAYSGY